MGAFSNLGFQAWPWCKWFSEMVDRVRLGVLPPQVASSTRAIPQLRNWRVSGMTTEMSQLSCAKQDAECFGTVTHLPLNNAPRQMLSPSILAQETETQRLWLAQDHTEFESGSSNVQHSFLHKAVKQKPPGLSSKWQAGRGTCGWVRTSTHKLGAWS